MTNDEQMSPPLRGIRVIDLATPQAELCGRLLADLGAEVIKVEPPAGAAARAVGPFAGDADHDPGSSLYWASVALGKRSVVLDVDDSADRERLLALIDAADVLVESFDPGFLGSLGMDHESLRRRNPALVYVSVTPFGQHGPDALTPATDLTLLASGGLLAMQGDVDRPHVPLGLPQAWFHAAAQAAADTVVALCERDRSGLGQHLDVSVQAAVVWILMNATGYPPNEHRNPPGTCETRGTPANIRGLTVPAVWPCADGAVVINVTIPVLGGRTLHAIAAWMEEDGVLPDALRGRDWSNWVAEVVADAWSIDDVQALIEAARTFLLGKRKAEIQALALKTGAIVGPIYTVADIRHDPQLEARDYWCEVDGRTHPGAFARLSRTPIAPSSPAPRLGEHQHLLTEHRPAAASIGGGANGERQQPFTGLKVADFSWVGVGPMIGKALGDHGATVVRVESETRPDPLRLLPPYKDGVPGINRSQFMANLNSSKLGLALNLATEEGREVARRLIDWADVVLESFTPGTMAKWGLDYETLAVERPDLIMLSTCLRGQTGPESRLTGFGSQGASLSGLHSITGWPDRPPCGPWGAYTDFINPRLGVAALAAAILQRRQSGEGQHIDLAQTEAGARFLEPLILDYTVNGRIAAPLGTRSLYESPHGVFPCAVVNRYIAISVATTNQWRSLVSAIGLTAFAGPDYDDPDTRRRNEDAIEAVIAAWCRPRDPFEAATLLKSRGVPASVALWPSDLYEDRQLAGRGFFVTLDHAEMGPTPYDGLATRYSATPGRLHRAAPALGQDSQFVLKDLLALPDEQIERLILAGAIV